MILDVIHAAAADPSPWWLSATAPWWAAPVSTLAGAVLAWSLARLSSGRSEKLATSKELATLKREVYSELWAAALEHVALTSSSSDPEAGRPAVVRGMEQMLTIELLAPPTVHAAAKALVNAMTEMHTPAARGKAMAAFRVAVAEELKIKTA